VKNVKTKTYKSGLQLGLKVLQLKFRMAVVVYFSLFIIHFSLPIMSR